MSTVNKSVNAIAALSIAGYLGTVVYRGNVERLFRELLRDVSYLEFLLGASILVLINQNPKLRPITLPLSIFIGFSILIRIMPQHTNLLDKITQYSQGKLSLFGVFGIDINSDTLINGATQEKGK